MSINSIYCVVDLTLMFLGQPPSLLICHSAFSSLIYPHERIVSKYMIVYISIDASPHSFPINQLLLNVGRFMLIGNLSLAQFLHRFIQQNVFHIVYEKLA